MNGPNGKRWRVKRKEVQADDGWTVVAGAGKSIKDESKLLQDAKPSGVVSGLTVEKLTEEFDDIQARWGKTTCAKHLEKMLGLRDWSIKEAVCIGIGSFSRDWNHRYRSMWQLALFMAVVKLLRQENPGIAIYAQEPAFNALDLSFLRALEITICSADIESRISSSSFVFAPFVDWYILLPLFLKDKDPELYVGNEILDNYRTFSNTLEKQKVLSECNELGKKFAGQRERRRVPDFELHANALNGLMVYWREEEEE